MTTKSDQVYDYCVQEVDIYEPIGTYTKRTGINQAQPRNRSVTRNMGSRTPGWETARAIDMAEAVKVDRRNDRRNRRKQSKVRVYRKK